MGILTTVFEWIKKVPWYVQIYLGLVLIPNIVMNALLVYFIFIPWHHSSIQAAITPMKEARDIEIASIVERQAIRDERTSSDIRQILQHQGIMYQALLNRQPALNNGP